MTVTTQATKTAVALWRYPVKSMQGEESHAIEMTERGVLGDRAYALLDPATGKVVSAKNPRKWGRLFDFRARFAEQPQRDGEVPPVEITLPKGQLVRSDEADVDQVLSEAIGRDVILAQTAPQSPTLEEYWPEIDGLAHQDIVTDEAMPPGTFFDLAVVHLLTTATIDQLRAIYPAGRFEVRRFRPNIVITPTDGQAGFIENEWIGQILAIGDEVRLQVTDACPRCVMTVLPQADLPRDPGILRAAAQHNNANVGVYASVIQGGTIRRGDTVQLV